MLEVEGKVKVKIRWIDSTKISLHNEIDSIENASQRVPTLSSAITDNSVILVFA